MKETKSGGGNPTASRLPRMVGVRYERQTCDPSSSDRLAMHVDEPTTFNLGTAGLNTVVVR